MNRDLGKLQNRLMDVQQGIRELKVCMDAIVQRTEVTQHQTVHSAKIELDINNTNRKMDRNSEPMKQRKL